MAKKQTKRPTLASPQKAPARGLGLIVLGGVILAALGLIVYALANQAPPYTPEVTGAPRAEVDQTQIDHGDVSFETPVTSVFNVRNVGDQPLVILGEPRVEIVEGC